MITRQLLVIEAVVYLGNYGWGDLRIGNAIGNYDAGVEILH